MVLVALLCAARLLLGGLIPLTEDEAYYRLWAMKPALGYFDHPPMIAWWISLGMTLGGDSSLGVRLAPILASAIMPLLVYALARRVGASPSEAGRAGLWYCAMLLVAAGGFIAVPDSPAALFWSLSLLAVLGAKAARSRPWAWWALAGAAAGLACLAKYSALFLGPGLLLWLSVTAWGRAALRTIGPWLALMIAGGLFGLNVYWNATHDWVTFTKQFGRVAGHAWTGRYLVEFLFTELLLINPLIALAVLRIPTVSSWRALLSGRLAPFALSSAPFIAYLLFHSLHDRIQAHWPAPVYPSLALCAALWPIPRGSWRAKAAAAAPGFALSVCIVALGYLSLPLAGVGLRFDPGLPIRGWGTFSEAVEARRRHLGATWIGAASYGVTAQLASRTEIKAPVLQITERLRWRNLPSSPDLNTATPGLLVDLPRRFDLEALSRCFASVRSAGTLERGPAGGPRKTYALFLVAGARTDVSVHGCSSGPTEDGP